MKEIMKERLESLVEERSEHAELNHTLENVLNLQDGLAYVKQYGKHPQNEKRKIIDIAYHQEYILHQFKESEKFIDTLIKSMIMSKSTITFKINLCKLLKKFLLLKHSTKSLHYFKNFFYQIKLICRTNENQFKNILME